MGVIRRFTLVATAPLIDCRFHAFPPDMITAIAAKIEKNDPRIKLKPLIHETKLVLDYLWMAQRTTSRPRLPTLDPTPELRMVQRPIRGQRNKVVCFLPGGVNAKANPPLLAFPPNERKGVCVRGIKPQVSVRILIRQDMPIKRIFRKRPRFGHTRKTHPTASLVSPPHICRVRQQHVLKNAKISFTRLDVEIPGKIKRIDKGNDFESGKNHRYDHSNTFLRTLSTVGIPFGQPKPNSTFLTAEPGLSP